MLTRNSVKTYHVVRHQRAQRVLEVIVDDEECMIKCSCKKFETEGIPCRHAVNIMKVENMTRIPEKMVLARWRTDCGKSLSRIFPFHFDVEETKIFRQASLCVLCNKICDDANFSNMAYDEAKAVLGNLHETLLRMKLEPNGGSSGASGRNEHQENAFNRGHALVGREGSSRRAGPRGTWRRFRHQNDGIEGEVNNDTARSHKEKMSVAGNGKDDSIVNISSGSSDDTSLDMPPSDGEDMTSSDNVYTFSYDYNSLNSFYPMYDPTPNNSECVALVLPPSVLLFFDGDMPVDTFRSEEKSIMRSKSNRWVK
ncbi:Zinc finger, PMZ-type [Corchorus capsularis]|uniref:Protein FAR1-RELATED SEQUENCE n=1 Tax=Corchorus capsularis TaxID=210143 RepID=A0A1R3HL80_COCAP|nr:Zinc finger, PMZ-type [Corchorus capsularis]